MFVWLCFINQQALVEQRKSNPNTKTKKEEFRRILQYSRRSTKSQTITTPQHHNKQTTTMVTQQQQHQRKNSRFFFFFSPQLTIAMIIIGIQTFLLIRNETYNVTTTTTATIPNHYGRLMTTTTTTTSNNQFTDYPNCESSTTTQQQTTPVPTPQQTKKEKKKKYAVATFVDKSEHIYGVYSIRNQMKRFNMTHTSDDGSSSIPFIVVIGDDYPTREVEKYETLQKWVGTTNIRIVNKSIIGDKIPHHGSGLWKGTFHKLYLFNLTEFDKVIVFDQDILIRKNIEHWFDYMPDEANCTVSAIQATDNIEWNSGAMVITPNTQVFEDMLNVLPTVTAYQRKLEEKDNGNDNEQDTRNLHLVVPTRRRDNMNSEYGDQGFLSAYFTHPTNPYKICTLPTQYATLSSSIGNVENSRMQYFVEHRLVSSNAPSVDDHDTTFFETIHLTTIKPWREKTLPRDLVSCIFMYEWMESIKGIKKYKHVYHSMKNKNPTKRCPKNTTMLAFSSLSTSSTKL